MARPYPDFNAADVMDLVGQVTSGFPDRNHAIHLVYEIEGMGLGLAFPCPHVTLAFGADSKEAITLLEALAHAPDPKAVPWGLIFAILQALRQLIWPK